MAINKATEALIPRLVASIEAQRRSIDSTISDHIMRGNLDRASQIHESYRNGHPNGHIRRPRKIRVATMEAAIDYLNTHKPTGVKEVIKRTTWQTNGAVDYYMQVTFSDIPAFPTYVGPEAAIMFAERVSDRRDEACRAREAVMESYYSMKEVVMEVWREIANLTITMRHEKADRETRLRLISLNGQLRRDLDHTFLASDLDEVRHLQSTSRALYHALDLKNDEIAFKAMVAIDEFIRSRKNAARLQDEVMEMTDSCDEFESKIRSGTLVAA